MTDFVLYHYSKEKFSKLLTREAQGVVSDKEKEKWLKLAEEQLRPGGYHQHVSFFIEPVPLDIIGQIFGEQHAFWYPGNVIYEHQIKASTLPRFKYEFVETPYATELYYDPKSDNLSVEEYYKLLDKGQRKLKERGDNIRDFVEVAERLKGLTRECYINLPSRPNWESIKDKYAATVPHVMVYPQSGVIKVSSAKQVVVGNKALIKQW